MHKILIALFTILSITGTAQQKPNSPYKNFETGILSPEPPAETEFLGRLVGVWKAERKIRNQDGTWSEAVVEADWMLCYILDGHAIQDDWILPPLDIEIENHERFYGTNIRIFNSDSGQWEMAWIDKKNRKLANFTATQNEHELTMEGTNNSRLIRNTFYNISDNSFDWVQKWTFDQGKSWVPVVEIHCQRKI